MLQASGCVCRMNFHCDLESFPSTDITSRDLNEKNCGLCCKMVDFFFFFFFSPGTNCNLKDIEFFIEIFPPIHFYLSSSRHVAKSTCIKPPAAMGEMQAKVT